jgi:Xaa-Pro aminopeptidase
MTDRLRRAQAQLAAMNLDGYVVSHLPHIRYLCGFSGSNALLLVGSRRAEFFTDGRYSEQVRTEVKGVHKQVPKNGNLIESASQSPILTRGRPRIGYQAKYMTVSTLSQLARLVDGRALLVPADGLVEPLAELKETRELKLIERAVKIVDRAFEEILPVIQPGVRESEVAAELEFIMLALGSEGVAFETICASGARSALPHGRASRKRIAMGDFVTLDYGATYGGYRSDITRTVVVGKATARHKKIYGIVARAQAAAVRKIAPGASTRGVDRAARQIIGKAGYGPKFGHGTGHGIGLEVHEGPGLSSRTDSRLLPGMVVTVEPGIYIPGFGGVRIEDDVLVTKTGHRVLTTAPRKLIEL